MTHSSHRFTMLSADDVALCRAHSEAIDDARESRALQRWADAVAPLVTPLMSVRAFEVGNHMPVDLPMPPSYWDDLEHWLKTLAPAKPAAERPAKSQDASGWRLGSDVPLHERVGLWHFRLGDGKYGGAGSRAVDAAAFNAHEWAAGHWQFRVAASGTKVGDPYDESKYTAPAQQPAQKASTHSVCIESYGEWTVGEVVKNDPSSFEFPRYWLPSDKSGWVTHVPTADSKRPVPAGVEHQVRWRNGHETEGNTSFNWYEQEPGGHSSDIIAWRPIAQS